MSFSSPQKKSTPPHPANGPVKSCFTLCKAGSQYRGLPKTNQDSYVQQVVYGPDGTSNLFAVFDGHGPLGHKVSAFLKQRVPTLLETDPCLYSNPAKALQTAIFKVEQELTHSKIDCSLSGSTANVVFIHKNTIFCANVGDSRAILIETQREKPVVVPLSTDHKVEGYEAQRIIHCGGQVRAMLDERGIPCRPKRVWVKGRPFPGLAMSRSMGDMIAKSAGVSCEPDITQHQINEHPLVLVVGSDGLYEFLSNQEISKFVQRKHEDLAKVAKDLESEARRRWRRNEGVVDDISCILVSLHQE